MVTKKQMAIDLAKRSLVDSIYASAKVEGLSVTFPSTNSILENIPTTARAEDVLFILNMRDAWRFVLDTLDEPITLAYLRQLNKICGDKLIYGSGDIRTVDVRIGGCSYVPGIPDYPVVVSVLDALRVIEDPVSRAITMFQYLAKAQLFIDGNKRLAQLVANQILIASGSGILMISRTEEFTYALIDFYETGSQRLYKFLENECTMRV